MGLKRRLDVLICGAGPVGLTAALVLARRGGLELEVIDEADVRAGLSYALALHPATLAALDRLGVAASLVERGNAVSRIAFYDGGERKLELSTAHLEGPFPFVLVIPQSLLEDALLAALAELGVNVRYSHRLSRLNTSSSSEAVVSCVVDRLELASSGYGTASTEWVVGKSYQRDVPFVVGADGHGSLVRRQLGIVQRAMSAPGVFATFEVATPPAPRDELRVTLTGGTRNVWWPLPHGRSRLSFEIDDEHAPVSARRKSRLPSFVPWTTRSLDADALRRLVAERMPWASVPGGDLMWSVAVRFERALATEFGRGRVWLAGDAAHLAFPFGVHSMNAGVAEAIDLAERIGSIAAGRSGLEVLVAYGEYHRAAWEGRLATTGFASAAAQAGCGTWEAEHAHEIRESLPALDADARRLLAEVGLDQAE